MNLKLVNGIKTKQEAQHFAIDWQKWASNQDLSYGELNKWQNYFIILANKFNLKNEFKENCII